MSQIEMVPVGLAKREVDELTYIAPNGLESLVFEELEVLPLLYRAGIDGFDQRSVGQVAISEQTGRKPGDDPRIFERLVSEDEQSRLWAMEGLVMVYGRFVNKTAQRLFDNLPQIVGIERSDLEQEGVLSLFSIAKSYTTNSNVSFLSFGGRAIRRSMYKCYSQAASGVHAPERVRLKISHIHRENNERYANRQRRLTIEETADLVDVEASPHFTVPPEKLTVGDLWLADKLTSRMLSTDVEAIPGPDQRSHMERSLYDYASMSNLTDRNLPTTIESEGLAGVDSELLGAAIAQLDPRDAEVLWLYFCLELKDREIAPLIGVNRQRVTQIRARALKQLRDPRSQLMRFAPFELVDR